MAKTELTLTIENELRGYAPNSLGDVKINGSRPHHYAFEVPVENGSTYSGMIDCVGIYEYFDYSTGANNVCMSPAYDFRLFCPLNYDAAEHRGLTCNEDTYCMHRGKGRIGVPEILIVCYEIKITKADFKSKNGHNFVGNQNYYVVPAALCRDKDIILNMPDGVGLIAYYDGTQPVKKAHPWSTPYAGLRRMIESDFKEMTDEEQKWMILSVLKRVRRST